MDVGRGEEPWGASRAPAPEGWLHIAAMSDTSFMSPPGNREVLPKILQHNKDLAAL